MDCVKLAYNSTAGFQSLDPVKGWEFIFQLFHTAMDQVSYVYYSSSNFNFQVLCLLYSKYMGIFLLGGRWRIPPIHINDPVFNYGPQQL
jgi:hypothetical protein